MALSIRLAAPDDVPALMPLMTASIERLLTDAGLDAAQVKASHAIMGIDTQLIDDGTYYVVEDDGAVAGCGGWSRRATLYGGNHSAGRDAALLDPATDAARIRAMYAHPDFTRRGVGRLILSTCEEAAAKEGFTKLQLMATVAGRPLYEGYGFTVAEETSDAPGGVVIPLFFMTKPVGT
jgi:GNAT superfamily N-acetyltransferase